MPKVAPPRVKRESFSSPGITESLQSAESIAVLLGTSPHRVYQLARAGQLPSVRLGRSVRFSPPAIRAWIEAGGTAGGQA